MPMLPSFGPREGAERLAVSARYHLANSATPEEAAEAILRHNSWATPDQALEAIATAQDATSFADLYNEQLSLAEESGEAVALPDLEQSRSGWADYLVRDTADPSKAFMVRVDFGPGRDLQDMADEAFDRAAEATDTTSERASAFTVVTPEMISLMAVYYH